MKEYNFEYFNQKFTSKFVGSLLILFLILFFSSIMILSKISIKNSYFVFICLFFSFIIPYIIYRFNRKNIKKQGTAVIYESYIEFNLDLIQRQIKFTDIKSYLIQNYNGTILNLVLKDGEKFNVAANINYCDTSKFDSFCLEVEKVLGKFNENNKLTIIRKKTFFEKAWLLPFLVILTCVLLFMVIYAFITGKKIPISSLLLTLSPLLTLWGGYFTARNRKRK